MMQARVTPRLGAAFLVGAGLLLWLSVSWGSQRLLGILASYVSPDQQITVDGERQFTSAALFLAVLSCLAGIVCWQIKDASGWTRLKHAVLSDPFGNRTASPAQPIVVLSVSTILGLLLVIHINLYPPTSPIFATLYFEDGVFETLTVVALIAAAACLAVALWRLRRERLSQSVPTGARVILGALMASFVVLCAEELSWGQRLLDWPTPAWFPAGNTQNELNVHNFFTYALPTVYKAFVLLPIPVLVCLWLAYTQRRWPAARLVLPHPSLVGLSLLIACVATVRPQEQELLEEMLALFALTYAICILEYSRNVHSRESCVKIMS